MPRNGSGVYGLPAGTTAVPNTPIESAKYNAATTDIAQALTDSVNVQGTAPFQADQPMGNHKLTGMAAGAAATDSPTLAQVQSSIVAHAASVGGSADAVALTFSPAFGAYVAKMRFRFTAAGANTLANPTVNVDGLGAKTLKKLNGQALAAGDIAGSGHVVDCVYDGTDVLMVSASAVNNASETVRGIVELATAAEARAGTDAVRAVTPAGLIGAARLKLAGNMSIYVRSDGNDGNDGLANTSGGAKLTWQAAINLAQTLDLNGFTLTIRCDQASASFTAGMIVPPMVGQKGPADFVIQGNTGSPANVTITATGTHAIEVLPGTRCRIAGFKLSTIASGHAINNSGAVVELGVVEFGACAVNHLTVTENGLIDITSNYTITDDAVSHFSASVGAIIRTIGSLTVSLTGTPSFSLFALCQLRASMLVSSITFSGNATGVRYTVASGGFVNTNGGGSNFFPGNSAGSTQTGGQYV